IARGTSLRGRLDDLAGRSVLVATEDQLTAALALLDLDGVARRMTVCPPDLHADHLFSVVAAAEADAIVTNRDHAAFAGSGVPLVLSCGLPLEPDRAAGRDGHATEWVLLTSGTTGPP